MIERSNEGVGAFFMTVTWILVAHGSSGRILQVSKNGQEISLIRDFLHPKTAMKGSEINSDKPGRSFESSGNARHAIDPAEDLKDHERRSFAKELSNYLSKAHLEHKFAKLIVVASRELLGELRKAIPDALKKIIIHELNKDLLSKQLNDRDLFEKIREDLGLVNI